MTIANTRLEVNCETGEIKEIPLTSEEILELEALVQQAAADESARVAAEEAKALAKASAESKLLNLGLTVEEIQALL